MGKGFCDVEKSFFDVDCISCTRYETSSDNGVIGAIKANIQVVPKDFEGLTAGQLGFLELVKSGFNVYLAGVGGTGKSYVLEKLTEECNKEGRQIIACAPTGIAALNIGGSTIHRVLKITPDDPLGAVSQSKIENNAPLLKCDLMIVDEISMCRCDLFDYLSRCLKLASRLRGRNNLPPIQLVVVGDFSQLPPVLRAEERPVLEDYYGYSIGNGYAFMGTEWESWHFHRHELTEVIRQRDANFAAALEAVRMGKAEGLRWIEDHAAKRLRNPIYICGKNSVAETRNKHQLDKIDKPETVYEAKIEGDVKVGDMPTAQRLVLKPGARVMALINDSQGTYMNGSLGTVLKCGDDHVSVEFDNGIVDVLDFHKWSITRPVLKRVSDPTKNYDATHETTKIEVEEIGSFTQIPLKLAYALTVHKAQGQTFDLVKIQPTFWDPGQLYTALSRAVSIDGLSLEKAIPDKSLITSQDVLNFYDNKPIERYEVNPFGGKYPELEVIYGLSARVNHNIVGDAQLKLN